MEDCLTPYEDLTENQKKLYELLKNPKSNPNLLDSVDVLEVIPRGDWGAAPPKSKEPVCTPLDTALILDTGSESCQNKEECLARIKELQTFYMEKKGLPDIPWNFLVGGDGNVYEGRGFLAKSSKLIPETEPFDGRSLDMAYIGDFRATMPPLSMTLKARDLFNLAASKRVLTPDHYLRSEIMVDFVDPQEIESKK